jgi:hypothetical protein
MALARGDVARFTAVKIFLSSSQALGNDCKSTCLYFGRTVRKEGWHWQSHEHHHCQRGRRLNRVSYYDRSCGTSVISITSNTPLLSNPFNSLRHDAVKGD